MPKSYYLDAAVINAALRQIPYVPPTASYVALYTVSPTQSTSGLEVAGGSYTRQPAVWTAPDSGVSTNVATITFPVATAPWGIVVAYALVDAVTAGNILYFAAMNAPQNVLINNQIVFPTGQLRVVED